MTDGDPYPVKAMFSISNNTLMAFANTRRVFDAMMVDRGMLVDGANIRR